MYCCIAERGQGATLAVCLAKEGKVLLGPHEIKEGNLQQWHPFRRKSAKDDSGAPLGERGKFNTLTRPF